MKPRKVLREIGNWVIANNPRIPEAQRAVIKLQQKIINYINSLPGFDNYDTNVIAGAIQGNLMDSVMRLSDKGSTYRMVFIELIGQIIDELMPDREREARNLLHEITQVLGESGLGTLNSDAIDLLYSYLPIRNDSVSTEMPKLPQEVKGRFDAILQKAEADSTPEDATTAYRDLITVVSIAFSKDLPPEAQKLLPSKRRDELQIGMFRWEIGDPYVNEYIGKCFQAILGLSPEQPLPQTETFYWFKSTIFFIAQAVSRDRFDLERVIPLTFPNLQGLTEYIFTYQELLRRYPFWTNSGRRHALSDQNSVIKAFFSGLGNFDIEAIDDDNKFKESTCTDLFFQHVMKELDVKLQARVRKVVEALNLDKQL